jgi:hypothetical protein
MHAVVLAVDDEPRVHDRVRGDEPAQQKTARGHEWRDDESTLLTGCTHPKQPGHHLMDVSVGESMMNSSVSLSNVAVVSRPRTLLPWPSSVCAYAAVKRDGVQH